MGRAQCSQKSINQCGGCLRGQSFPIIRVYVSTVTETHKPALMHLFVNIQIHVSKIKISKA